MLPKCMHGRARSTIFAVISVHSSGPLGIKEDPWERKATGMTPSITELPCKVRVRPLEPEDSAREKTRHFQPNYSPLTPTVKGNSAK